MDDGGILCLLTRRNTPPRSSGTIMRVVVADRNHVGAADAMPTMNAAVRVMKVKRTMIVVADLKKSERS